MPRVNNFQVKTVSLDNWIYSKRRLFSRDWVIVLCRKVFNLRNEEKDLSAVEVVTGNVKYIFSAYRVFSCKGHFHS